MIALECEVYGSLGIGIGGGMDNTLERNMGTYLGGAWGLFNSPYSIERKCFVI